MSHDDRHWAMELGDRREPWGATLRGALPFAVAALLLAVMAAAALFHGIRAIVLSGGDWGMVLSVPLRSAFPEKILQPAGTILEWSSVLFLLTTAGAAWLAYLAVDRARSRRRG